MNLGRLRDALQAPTRWLVALDTVAILAGTVASASVFILKFETDAEFHVVEALFAVALLLLGLAVFLSAAKRSRRAQVVAVPLLLVLGITVGANWVLCWMAGLGGSDCWWLA